MSDIKNTNYRNLMKLNGFKKDGNYYDRDDGIHIDFSAGMWNIVYGDGTVIYCESREQMVGELVLRNIINRFYF